MVSPLRALFELWVSVYQIELNYKIIFLVQCFIFVYIFFLLGWDEGCLKMQKGEVAKLTIPSEKGYGSTGFSAWGYPFISQFV